MLLLKDMAIACQTLFEFGWNEWCLKNCVLFPKEYLAFVFLGIFLSSW